MPAGRGLECVVGLGANLGDRLATLRRVVAEVERRGWLRAVSRVYESAAIGPPQPDYLNAAVLLQVELEPAVLLGELLALERAEGRVRDVRWGPRTLDLDLLWIRGLIVRQPGLEVPHPRLKVRPFALRPLLDVVPDAHDPAGVPYTQHLAGLGGDGIEPLDFGLR